MAYTRDPTTGQVTAGRLDTLLGQQESNQTTSTYQFSQEFRYETQWDGPVQLTGGVLFWQDHRQLEDRNNITFCAPYGRSQCNSAYWTAERQHRLSGIRRRALLPHGGSRTRRPAPWPWSPALCDGAGAGLERRPAGSSTGGRFPARSTLPARGMPGPAHLSFYGRVDWQMTEDLNLSLEDRFVDE